MDINERGDGYLDDVLAEKIKKGENIEKLTIEKVKPLYLGNFRKLMLKAQEEKDIIRDPIHGYIVTYPWETTIIDTPEFQRLRSIKQTPGTSYVYPGANHTRFEHSLGVLQLMGELINVIRQKYSEEYLEDLLEVDKPELEFELSKVRMGALLHDIGHCPFSHAFEDFIREVKMQTGESEFIDHEDISQELIVKLLNKLNENTDQIENKISKEFYENLTDMDINHISRYAVGRPGNPKNPFYAVIGNTIDIDKLDWLLRDAYKTGAEEYGKIDAKRILLSMNILELTEDEIEELKHHETTFNYKGDGDNPRIGIDESAVTTLHSLLISKFKMFQNVYYHRTTRAVERTLIEMLKELYRNSDSNSLLKKLVSCKDCNDIKDILIDDYLEEFIYNFNDQAVLSDFYNKRIKMFFDFQKRAIFKRLYSKNEDIELQLSNLFYTWSSLYYKYKNIERELQNENVIKENTEKLVIDVPFPIVTLKPSKVLVSHNSNKISTLQKFFASSEKTLLLQRGFIRDGKIVALLPCTTYATLKSHTKNREDLNYEAYKKMGGGC